MISTTILYQILLLEPFCQILKDDIIYAGCRGKVMDAQRHRFGRSPDLQGQLLQRATAVSSAYLGGGSGGVCGS
jgi:hypothetical protein